MQAREFGEFLRALRKEKGLTIRQIETYTGVSNSYLSLVENGKRGIPSPDILKQLAPALKVTYEFLMEKAGYIEQEDPKPPTTMDPKDLEGLIRMRFANSKVPRRIKEHQLQSIINSIKSLEEMEKEEFGDED